MQKNSCFDHLCNRIARIGKNGKPIQLLNQLSTEMNGRDHRGLRTDPLRAPHEPRHRMYMGFRVIILRGCDYPPRLFPY
jgi:hypothetical protein